MPDASGMEMTHLEIDRAEKKLRFCPLLKNPKEYVADTVDLTRFENAPLLQELVVQVLIFSRDNDAREYWLQCFQDSLQKFTERAIQSQVFLFLF